MIMDKWQSELDRQLEKLRQAGAFDNLPGMGKPLNLADESHVPQELRMAYRMLRDNDMAPDWVMLGKDIEQSTKHLRQSITCHLRQYQDGLAKASTPEHRQNVERVWMNAQHELRSQVKAHNNMVLTFNLKAPAGIRHHILFDLEHEIAQQKS